MITLVVLDRCGATPNQQAELSIAAQQTNRAQLPNLYANKSR